MIRKPAVAGSFYSGDRESLISEIEGCYLGPYGPGTLPPAKPGGSRLVACVAPHAGYQYSGQVAAHSFLAASSLPDPELLVVVAPNHYGVGSGVATFRDGEWETPLGLMAVDAKAAADLTERCELVAFDEGAHKMEHSLEVELPFLQHIYGWKVPMLPVSMLLQDADTAVELGNAIASVVSKKKAVIIASSDLTHYESYEAATNKDRTLLTDIVGMDVDSFYGAIEALQATACGYGPVAAVITAAKALGMKKGQLLKYANSGDTGGDRSSVVGYGSVRFS